MNEKEPQKICVSLSAGKFGSTLTTLYLLSQTTTIWPRIGLKKDDRNEINLRNIWQTAEAMTRTEIRFCVLSSIQLTETKLQALYAAPTDNDDTPKYDLYESVDMKKASTTMNVRMHSTQKRSQAAKAAVCAMAACRFPW